MSIQINGTSGISGVDGSATTPALQGTDTNTGLTFGTDTVGIVTGGTTRATVDANGDFSVNTDAIFVDASTDRVGIGVTDPAEELEVSGSGGSRIALNRSGNDGYGYIGTGTTNDLQFGRDGSGSLEYGRFDSSGRLLINGTTSHTWSGGQCFLQVSGTSASGNVHLGAFQYSNSADGGELVLGSSRGTTVGANTIVQNNDTLGRIRFCAADGVDFTNRGGEISCRIDGTPGSDDIPTRMMFFTANASAGSPTERMRLASTGVNYVWNGNGSTAFIAASSVGSGTTVVLAVRRSAGSIDGGTNAYFIYANGSAGSASDVNLKKNIETTRDGYLEDLNRLRVVKYNWNDQEDTEPRELGLIAQEVEEVFPGLVCDMGGTDEEGEEIASKGIKYSVLPVMLLKALQEADQKIDDQAALIESQAAQLTSQAASIASLEARLTALEGGTN